MEQMLEELKALEATLKERDQWLFRYFYAVAPIQEAEALKKDYIAYFNQRSEAEKFRECVNAMMAPLEPVFQGETIPIETILELIGKHKSDREPAFKNALRQLTKCFGCVEGLQGSVAKFLETDYQYFHEKSFFENELQELHHIVQECWEAINNCVLGQFKAIVVKQDQIETGRVSTKLNALN
ncbi:hypothetical protein [Pseudocnuella soli]|uniref:hypothetical protein n=1 Tax=Pseudocnuella soli TaxID=2502779 RepID=UPI001F026D47|nr:hypothetical protein [Pseudocnuella soli]